MPPLPRPASSSRPTGISTPPMIDFRLVNLLTRNEDRVCKTRLIHCACGHTSPPHTAVSCHRCDCTRFTRCRCKE